MAKISRKSQNSTSKFQFVCQKATRCHYFIQNVKDITEIRVCKSKRKKVTYFSQFILAKSKKISRKSQAQLWEKLKGMRFRQKIAKQID